MIGQVTKQRYTLGDGSKNSLSATRSQDTKQARRGKLELSASSPLMAETSDEIRAEKQKPADLSVSRQVGCVSSGAE